MATPIESPDSTMLSVGSYDTALCLVPPRHLWPSIDRLRMLYDKAYEKWPPHANIIYPFVGVDSLSAASEIVLSELKNWKQENSGSTLLVRLDEAGVFSHRHDNTIFICDKDPAHASDLAGLRQNILDALGRSPDNYQMHLTIGQSEDLGSSPHKYLLNKASLLPIIEWHVEELHILVRKHMQIDGNTTSQMKLWGIIDFEALSISRMNEPVTIYEGGALAQTTDTEHTITENVVLSNRPSYVYSPLGEKWSVYSPPSTQYETEASPPQSLTIASYNVLAEFDYPPSHDRYPIIVQNLLDESAISDVLVLEEVADDFLSYLLRNNGIRGEYRFVSCGPPEQPDVDPLPSHLNTVVLSKWPFFWDWLLFRGRHKGSAILRFNNIGKQSEDGFLPVILSTVHLTCGLMDGSVASKKLELQSILRFLSKTYPQNPWILAGDFNMTTSAYTIDAALKKKVISSQTASYLDDLETMLAETGLADAWAHARVQYGNSSFDQDERNLSEIYEGEDGATFDPTVNELAADNVGSGFNNRPQRYDRILVRGLGLFTICGFNMFGKSKRLLGHQMVISEGDGTQGQTSYGSDHWGIRCSLKVTSHPSIEQTDDSSTSVVPVEPRMASGKLGDISELRECLLKRNVFPSEADISGRQAAFALLKEIILEDVGLDHARGRPAFVLTPVGSYGLGIWTPSSDVDCLCIGPVSTRVFFTLAVQRLRKAATRGAKILRRVNAHSGTMLELEVQGVRMDLQYCPSTFIAETWPYAMLLPPNDTVFGLSTQILSKLKPVRDLYYLRRTIPDFGAFRLAYQFIKCWARQRGIYAARFGYLGGIHIAILLCRVCKLLSCSSSFPSLYSSVPTILTTFFDHYAGFDWENRAAFDPFFHRKFPPGYARTAREPMSILGFHPPGLNVAHAASAPSTRTLVQEMSRAAAILSRDDMTWAEFLGDDTGSGAAEFLNVYKMYVRIDAQFWGVSLAKGSTFVGWLESRCVMLLVDLNRRLPNMDARIWPSRFVDQEVTDDDKDLQGCYLIGLGRLPASNDQSIAKDQIKIMIGTLRTVLEKFEKQIRGDERYFDAKFCWMSASLAKQSDVGHLRLDSREWGEYTIGEDESEDEDQDEEDETLNEDINNDVEATTSSKKKKKLTSKNIPPSHPAYTGKFRSSADVISRLRWDPSMDSGDYIVGYEDRFLGIRERALDQWKSEQTDEEFIPQHRIAYFKRKSDGAIIWDRKLRKDDIFGSGVNGLETPTDPIHAII